MKHKRNLTDIYIESVIEYYNLIREDTEYYIGRELEKFDDIESDYYNNISDRLDILKNEVETLIN